MNPNDPQANPNARYGEPPKKSTWWKWLLGCGCGCVTVVALTLVGLSYAGFSFFKWAEKTVAEEQAKIAKRQVRNQNMKTFTNSAAGLTGTLAANYVDFSIQYPANWTLDPNAGQPGSNNFVELDNSVDNFTVEHISIGTFKIIEAGAFMNEASMKVLAHNTADNVLGKAFGGVPPQKLGSGMTKFSSYDAYELRCTTSVKANDGSTLQFWFKLNLVKNPDSDKGVMVIMYATDKSLDVKGINDVGVKGDLPAIVESFEFE